MKNPINRIASESQYTKDVEGYVFDGADGSQVCFWKCSQDRSSTTHCHEYDEYRLVVQGEYTIIVGEDRFRVLAGQEFVIPKGVTNGGEGIRGTRTIHLFGGQRSKRMLAANS